MAGKRPDNAQFFERSHRADLGGAGLGWRSEFMNESQVNSKRQSAYLQVRPARREDGEAVAALASKSVSVSCTPLDDMPAEELQLQARREALALLHRSEAAPELRVWVAEDATGLRGYLIADLGAKSAVSGRPQAFIVDVALTPARGARQVAAALVEEAIKCAKAQGVESISAAITVHNRKSLEMARALGFEVMRYEVARRC